MKKTLCIISALIIIGTLGSGCENKGSTQTEASVRAKEKTPTIAVIPPGTTSPFHSQIAKGAQQHGESLKWKVKVQAPEDECDFNKQASIFVDFVNKKVAAISVNAIDDMAIGDAIKKANDAKIPVFVHNSQTPIPKGDVVEYIGYNQRTGGYACGEYAAGLLNGKGEVFILDGIPGFHQIERTGGFLDALKQYQDIKVVGEQSADWDRDTAVNVALQALKKYPYLNLFFCDSDEMAIGASIAAKKLGKRVYTVGIDGNPITLDEISNGNVTATLGVYPDKIGSEILVQMEKHFRGVKIPLYLETSAVVVDKNNIEDYKSGKLWKDPIEGSAEELQKK